MAQNTVPLDTESHVQPVTESTSGQPIKDKLAIQNILCPVDFSEFSLKAFSYAAAIARHFRSRLFLQHTVQLPSSYLGGWEPLAIDEMLRAEMRRAGAEMRRLAARVRLELPEVFMHVNERGSPQDCILKSINDHSIDLVVMGTHGRRGFNRLMLGSVAESLVHQAACPVLVICRPTNDFISPDEPEPCRLHTVLIATDFSPSSSRALTHALNWASEWSAKVILFHAVEQTPSEAQGRVDLFPEYNPFFEKQLVEAWEAIRAQAPRPARENCEVSCEVRHGNAKEQILQLAAEQHADLIVMGSRGLDRSAPTWGSTISGVLRDGRFPVLAVRDAAA